MTSITAHPATSGGSHDPKILTINASSPRDKSARISALLASIPRQPLKGVITETPSMQRPLRDVANVTDIRKARETVSVAGIFKNNRKSDTHSHERKSRRGQPQPPDLLHTYYNAIEETRVAIDSNAKATFEDVHEECHQELMGFKASDAKFIETVTRRVHILSAPLSAEVIQTQYRRGGKKITEIVKIGDRVEAFKKLVREEEEKLKEYWNEWDEVQNEYIALGIEVFGPEAFGEEANSVEGKAVGFKREMELLDLEHNTRLEELSEDIEDIGVQTLSKIKNSEKELNNATKKEQARLLQSLLM